MRRTYLRSILGAAAAEAVLMCVVLCGCGGAEAPAVQTAEQAAAEQGAEQADMSLQEPSRQQEEMTAQSKQQEDSQQEQAEETEKTEQEKQEEAMKYFEGLQITESYKGLEDTNPLMTQRFGADPYALVYEDRVYIYMTADAFEYGAYKKVEENTYSKINQINVISTDDMVNFTDHGSIKAASKQGAATWAKNSWAPAAAWKEINGKPKFFLYFADNGGGIGVLQADSPTGPFEDPLGEALISRQTPECADVLWLFDPAVLMDDDGKAYLYFGGGVPEGKADDPGTARVVELGEDMISIVGEPKRMNPPYLFEDSGIHKAGDKYYYTYCSNFNVDAAGTEKYGFESGEIICMESDSPMGPFTFKERILKNPGSAFGLGGNNHHCVFRFRDQWYITYHTRVLEQAMGVEKGYRCTHIDAFTMQEDGTIGEIKQTLKGREQLQYVDPYAVNRAASCAVMGGVNTVPADDVTKDCGSGNMALSDIESGDFIKVQGVDFGTGSAASVIMTVRNKKDEQATGAVKICLDSPEGTVLGYLSMDNIAQGEDFTERSAALSEMAEGVHDLYFVFAGENYQIETWQFVK